MTDGAPSSLTLRSGVFHRWWPTTQSMDLVEGDVDLVAEAIGREIARFVPSEPLTNESCHTRDLDDAFRLVGTFTNVPTTILALPTRSRWTVLWNNSFLCAGYDSLCHCLTMNHGLTTVHWSTSDARTTFQAGSGFIHRRRLGTEMAARQVQASEVDGRWHFHQSGTPLPEEDLARYEVRRLRDRLDEASLLALLGRLNAAPWSESFYALPGRIRIIQRPSPPATVIRRSAAAVLNQEIR